MPIDKADANHDHSHLLMDLLYPLTNEISSEVSCNKLSCNEMSVTNCRVTKCRSNEMSVTNCRVTKCRVYKCRVTKCRYPQIFSHVSIFNNNSILKGRWLQ